MPAREILLLGDPRLYQVCDPVTERELSDLQPVVSDLHDTLMAFRDKWNAGRAIAAPQIGVMKRLVYMHIDEPIVFINPVLDLQSNEMMELWDDCMSFPDLLVRIKRHEQCRITYRDMHWNENAMRLEGDLSELLQHEVDHLDGILAIARALDDQSIIYRSQRQLHEV